LDLYGHFFAGKRIRSSHKNQLVVADLDPIALLQHAFRDKFAVNKSAVLAVEVTDHNAVVHWFDRTMVSGDPLILVWKPNPVVPLSAKRQHAIDRIHGADECSGHEDELGRHWHEEIPVGSSVRAMKAKLPRLGKCQ